MSRVAFAPSLPVLCTRNSGLKVMVHGWKWNMTMDSFAALWQRVEWKDTAFLIKAEVSACTSGIGWKQQVSDRWCHLSWAVHLSDFAVLCWSTAVLCQFSFAVLPASATYVFVIFSSMHNVCNWKTETTNLWVRIW